MNYLKYQVFSRASSPCCICPCRYDGIELDVLPKSAQVFIFVRFGSLSCFTLRTSDVVNMQGQEDSEPTVRIRELKKDRVNFALENVDLA